MWKKYERILVRRIGPCGSDQQSAEYNDDTNKIKIKDSLPYIADFMCISCNNGFID